MYVRKSDVGKYGRTPGCHGCRDVVLGRDQCKPHSAECRERMTRLLSETDAGSKRVKAAEDRWVNAAVRRSDIIFAEAEEKKRRTGTVESPVTGGAAGDTQMPGTSSQVASEPQDARGTKRGADEQPEGDEERSKFMTTAFD